MEKVKSKISLIAIMFLWTVTILTGCGNPYKNMRLVLDSAIAMENEQYTYDVDLEDGQSTTFSFDVRIEGAKKKVSTDVHVSSTQTEIASIEGTSKEGNKTRITMSAHRVGQSVVTIKSAEGNLSKSVIVRVHIPLEDIQVASSQVYVERGVAVDVRQFLTFIPSATDRSDVVLSLKDQNAEMQESVILEGNTFTVAKMSTLSSFGLSIQSKHNADIETKELSINVVDVVQPDQIVPKYLRGNEYIELTKSTNGNYLLSMAQNSSNVQDFTRNLYFFVRTVNAITGQEEDVLLDQSTYSLGVVDAFGDLKEEYSNAYVDITKIDNYFSIMELTMGTSTVTFGYNHNKLSNSFIKKIDIDVQVQYYPESIVVTNGGRELGQTNPMTIYDDDRVNGVNNAIQVSVLTVGNNVLARSPFYVRLVGEQKQDYKVTLSNRYGEIDENLTYTAQDAPFYITHNYPLGEMIGQFELEFVSAVPDVQITTRIPLEFVRGEMNINTNQDIYYLNVDGENVVGGNMQHVLLTGINSADVWQRIQIIGMNQELVSYDWLEDYSGLVIRANEKGMTGRFNVRLVAPNGNVKVITIVVFHELQSAGVYVGNVVSTNKPVMAIDESQIGNVQDKDIPVYEFLAGSTIPLNYLLNGQNVSQFFEGVIVTANVSSRGVTVSNDRKNLIIGNSSMSTIVELKVEGYDQWGQSRSSVKYIIFKVQPVLPITEVNMAKADGSTSYTIYSSSHLSSLQDDSYKKAFVRYRVYPASATYKTPVWNVYGPQGEKIVELTYSKDERSTQSLSIIYTENTKQYICTYYGSRISFVLDFSDNSYLEVSANLSEFDLLTLRVGVSLTQEYQDINNNKTLFVSDEAYVTIQVLMPTKVSAIRFENLEKENEEYVYHFDIRNMTQSGQLFTSGNTSSIRTLVYPYNAVNTNVEIKTTLYTSRDGGVTYTTSGETGAHYLDYRITSTKGKEYEKEITIELLRNLNEDNLTRYIEVTINALDSNVGSAYNVSNRFRVYLLDGSVATPFRIRSASDIDDIRKGLNSHYLLINNVDLSYYITSRMNGSWQPIGSFEAPFTGSLSSFITEERQAKYTISGLSLYENTNTTLSLSSSVVEGHTEYYGGLFGYVGAGASIQNIDINMSQLVIHQNKGVTGDYLYVGVLAGYVAQDAIIAGVGIFDNNGATENVKGTGISFDSNSPITAYLGGMIGYNEGKVLPYSYELNAEASLTYTAGNKVNVVMAVSDEVITGANTILYVGGLAGYNGGEIATLQNNQNILGIETYDVVVDINPNMPYHVENTQFALSNTSSALGGLVGYNEGTIKGFEVKSKINAFDRIGGIAGVMHGGTLQQITVAPIIRGNQNIGGMIGYYDGFSTLDDLHVEFYESKNENSIQNASMIGTTNVGGLIGYSIVGDSAEMKNISIYSYTKKTPISYSPTATSEFFGDLIATANEAYLSAGVGRWETTNSVNVTYNNWFVLTSLQAISQSDNMSAVAYLSSSITANATALALNITTPNEINDQEVFAFKDIESTNRTNCYAMINNNWVGTTYEDILKVSYQYDEENGNENSGFHTKEDGEGNVIDDKDGYMTALFYTHPAYTIDLDGQSKVYPINLAGTKAVNDQKVNLLVNLPPIAVTCTASTTYVSMVRLADSAYDGSGNIIGDMNGEKAAALATANCIAIRDVLQASAIPAFLSKARITLTSSDNKIAEVITKNGETYLQLKGLGVVTITITSLYDKTLTASANIQVVDKIVGFGIYEDDVFSQPIETVDVEKGSTLPIYANVQKEWEGLVTKFDTNYMGVEYVIDNVKTKDGQVVEKENYNQYVTLNGQSGFSWDSALGQITVKGLQEGLVSLIACPYYIIGGEKVTVEKYKRSFNVNIMNGTQSIYIDSQSTNIVFEPSNTTQRFVVNVATDKADEELILMLTDHFAKTYTFSLNTKEFETEFTYKTIELGYINLTLEQFSKLDHLMSFVFHVSANMEKLINENVKIDENTNSNEIEVLDIISAPITFNLSFYVLEHGKTLTSTDKNVTADNKYNVSGDGLAIVNENEQVVLSSIKQSITNYPTLNITMTTQELQEGALSIYHYPNNLEKKNENDQFVFNGEEVPYDNILSGVPGLLKIDYLPAYANIAYLEISSSAVGGEYIRFDQMLKTYNSNDITYVRDTLNTEQVAGRARLSQRSVESKGWVFFNGEYYIRTLIPSSIPAGSSYTITIDAYRYTIDGNVEKVVTLTKELTVLTPPSVELRTNAVAVARGTAQDFTLKINGLDETTILSFEGSTLTKGNVTYSYGNYFTITNYGGDVYQAWVSSAVPSGAELKIVYTVSKRINGTVITETNKEYPLTLMVADFVVNAIGVDRVYNNYFVGELNQFYQLKVVLTDVSYNPLTLGVRRAIENLEDELSQMVTKGNTPQSSTWWVREGLSFTQIHTNRYAGFDASFVDGVTKIKNTVLTTNALLQARVYIKYGQNGIEALSSDEIAGQDVQFFTYDFGFNCYRYTDESNPTPIYNVDQFIEMVDNGVGDYRLMSDIKLTNWAPRDSYHTTSDTTSGSNVTGVISSLDGNGYVIEIESFNQEAIASTGIAGLFATVHEDTMLKNLVVLLAPTIPNVGNETIEMDKEGSGPLTNGQSTDQFDITIDMTGATSAVYGTIAGINNGMITNCQVTYNTEAYQDKRVNEMLGDPASQVTDKQDILSFEEYELYNNNNSGEKLKVDGQFHFYQKAAVENFHRSIYDNTEGQNGVITKYGRTLTSIFIETDLGVSAYVGGLVGRNNGYITNSRVEHISIKGSGFVAGLVAENTNKISSSYYYDGNIKNNFNSEENNAGTAGLVTINSGTIAYSYVEGRNKVSVVGASRNANILNHPITSVDYSSFTGYNYECISYEGKLAQSIRSTASAINTNTHAGGFVYMNSGTITNSYANILVNSTANSAGFVYDNRENGEIREVYSLSSVRINQRNASQFSGRTSSGTYLNKGVIEHSVYLKVEGMAAVVDGASVKIEDSVTDDIYADYISLTQFGRYSSFTGYAFNQDYQINSAKEVAKSVWFIPQIEDYNRQGSDIYFDIMSRDYYLPGRPQLVGANLETRSSYYLAGSAEDENGNIKYQYGHMAEDEGSETNPYLVYDATLLDTRMNDIQNNRNELAKQDNGSQSKYPEPYNIRLIRDFSYSEKPDHKATTYNVTFSGILDGNGMEVQDLVITASKDSDETGADGVITQAGWFGNIENGTVKNLTIEVMEVSATGIPFVGVLSGVIHSSNIYNVTINPTSSNAFISGANVLGGLSGLVYGKSQLVGITSNVSITSYFKSGSNLFNFENTIASSGDFAILEINDQQDGLSKYSNYNKVSYVGGIVGIMDADAPADIDEDSVAVAQTSQARRLSVGQDVRLAGEIVGGIMGYMGRKVVSVNDEIRLGTTATMSIIASRVAGGIVGENHGTLQRSYVAHDVTTQETIDQAQKLGVFNDLNYRSLFGTPTDGNGTSRNAHFIGGLVGLNMGGTIENSYNKVTVYSPNARAAGGLVGLTFGGTILSSYTTASVGAYSKAGGLVGREGKIALSTSGEGDSYHSEISKSELGEIISNYYMRVSSEYYDRESITKQAKYEGAIAANVFSESDLNLMLRPNGEISPYYTIGAFIGQIDDVVFDENVAFSSYNFDRMKKEVNYAQKLTIKCKDEMGRDTTATIPEFGKSDIALITGGVYELNPTTGVNNYYLYRDLGYYSSLRRQEEFVARRMLWENDQNTWKNNGNSQNTWNNYEFLNNQGEAKSNQGNAETIITSENAFAHLDGLRSNTSSIYNTYLDMYWNGHAINQNLEVIDEAYVYPELRAEVYDMIVYVYTVDDLKKINVYPDAIFILMNDIDLSGEAWTPLAQEKAFTGTLTSNDGEEYTIQNLYFTNDSIGVSSSTPNNSNIGLIARAKRATFTNFNVTLKADSEIDVSTNLSKSAIAVQENYGLNYGNLVGYVEGHHDTTIFRNIGIHSQSATSTLNLKNINSYGGVVGAGNSMSFEQVTVGKTIQVEVSTLVKSNKTATHGLGGIVGVAMQEKTPINDSYYQPLQLTDCQVDNHHITITGKELESNHSSLFIGGVVGHASGQERTAENLMYTLDVQVTNVTLNESMEDKSESKITDLAMGGVIGSFTGNTGNLNIKDLNNTLSGWSVDEVTLISTYQKASKTSIGGWVGKQETNNSDNANYNLTYAISDVSPTITINVSHTEVNVYHEDKCVGGLFGKVVGVSMTSATANEKATIDAANISIQGSMYTYGTLAGCMQNTSTIENIKVNNHIASILNTEAKKTNIHTLGGLVGRTNGVSITDCEIEDNTKNIVVASCHGGVVGQATIANGNKWENISLTIPNTTLNGDVVGGLVGSVTNNGTLSHVMVTTNIYGDNIGGIAGIVSGNGSIIQSITKGQLSNSGEEVGGLVGSNSGNTISQSIAEMNIVACSSSQQVGGLVGSNSGNINNSYSQGYINLSNADSSHLSGFGGLVGVHTSGSLSRNYTISRYVYGTNVKAYYDIQKGGLVGSGSGTIETHNWYVSDITPYSNEYGTMLYMDDLLGITLHELVNETQPTSNTTWWIHSGDNELYRIDKTPQLRWAKDITTNIIETKNTGTINNILYQNAVDADGVGDTGLVILKGDNGKVVLYGNNRGVIFGGKTSGNTLNIQNNEGVVDYFRIVEQNDNLINGDNSGLIHRISYIGAQPNFMSGSNNGEIRDSQLFTTGEIPSSFNGKLFNSIYAKQDLSANAGWGDTNGNTLDVVIFNQQGKKSKRTALVVDAKTEFKIIFSHNPNDYTTLDFDKTWIIIRTSNKAVDEGDITRRTLNYGYPVLRWTLQDNYQVSGSGRLSDKYYWGSSDSQYANILNNEINKSGYDIDLGNKLWTPLDGNGKSLTGFLQTINDSEIDTTEIDDTFGGKYTSDRGQTLNRIYNMTIYNDELENVGLFQTINSATNIRMENALVYNTKSGANVGTIAGTLGNGQKLASVNSALVAKSATNVGAIAGVANSVTYAYNIYTTGGRSLEGENKEYSYTNGIEGGRITGQIVGNGNVNQAYTPLQNENITGNGTVTSCFNGNSNLTTDILEGFNWQVWTRINDAKHYNSLPYIDGNIPFWIDGVQHVERSGYYYNGVSTGIREGAASSTIEVLTPQQLAVVAYMVNVEGKNVSVKLMDDIDLSSNIWTPMGTATRPYLGTFNGNGHTISGLTLSRVHDIHDDQDNAGLFGVTTNATISNLTIENAQITFTDNNAGKTVSHVGALVGNASGGTIRDIAINNVNIYTNGKIVGSVIGTMNNTSVTNVGATTAHLCGNTFVGGIIGKSNNGTLETSFVNNSTLGQVVASIMPNAVDRQPYQGGLIAHANNTNILEVVASNVDITNQNDDMTYVGELFGKVTYTNTTTSMTTSMTTGMHNLYAHDVTTHGNTLGKLYHINEITGLDENYNVTMLYSNHVSATPTNNQIGGLPLTSMDILQDNAWWNNLLAHIGEENAQLKNLVSRPYYVASDADNAKEIGLGDLLATLSLRYYGQDNVPTSRYTLTDKQCNTSIYYNSENKIIKSAGTANYPVKNVTLTSDWNGTSGTMIEISTQGIDSIFKEVSNSTIANMQMRLSGTSLIDQSTELTMEDMSVVGLTKPLIVTVESGTYHSLTLTGQDIDGGVFAETITGGELDAITVSATNIKGAGIALSMTGGSIANCSVSGTITGGKAVNITGISGERAVAGGVLGYATIALGDNISCSATLNLTDRAEYVGGLVGYSTKGSNTNNVTYSGPKLSKGTYVGGLYGYATTAIAGGSISSSIAISEATYAGGIAGKVEGSISSATLPSIIRLENVRYAGAIAGACGTVKTYALGSNASITITGLSSATQSAIGGLVGILTGNLKTNTTFKGTISGPGYVGGLVGEASGTISGISSNVNLAIQNNSTGNVTESNSALGGIVGYLTSGTIQNVTNNANIKTSINNSSSYKKLYNIGGIVGKMDGGTITGATSNTQVIAEESINVGGIVGNLTSGTITNPSNIEVNERVIGLDNVGAIVGNSGETSIPTTGYTFGQNVDVHAQGITNTDTNTNVGNVGLYSGTMATKHDSDKYYYVIFEGWDGLSQSYEKPVKCDYSIIRSTQYAYYMNTNGESVLTDKNEAANYTYKDLEDSRNGTTYWGYFNFCRVNTTAWHIHALNRNSEGLENPYRHELHLKKYTLGTADFYGTDNGYYVPPMGSIYDGSNNRNSSFYDGNSSDEITMSFDSNCISIKMISSKTYTWEMLQKYSSSQNGNTSDMPNLSFNNLQKNNALKIYNTADSYTHYSYLHLTQAPTVANYHYVGLREVFSFSTTNNLYGVYDSYEEGSKGSEDFTVAINSMGNLNTSTNKYRLIDTSLLKLLDNSTGEIKAGRSYSYLWVSDDLKVPVFNKYEGSAQSLSDVKALFNKNKNDTAIKKDESGYIMANESTSFEFCGSTDNWRIYVFAATPTAFGKPTATKLQNINETEDNPFDGFDELSIATLSDVRIGDVYERVKGYCMDYLEGNIQQTFIPFIQFMGAGMNSYKATQVFSSDDFTVADLT